MTGVDSASAIYDMGQLSAVLSRLLTPACCCGVRLLHSLRDGAGRCAQRIAAQTVSGQMSGHKQSRCGPGLPTYTFVFFRQRASQRLYVSPWQPCLENHLGSRYDHINCFARAKAVG